MGEHSGWQVLADALAEHDSAMEGCPVRNPQRGRVARPDDKCQRCGAKASGSCGLFNGQAYSLIERLRLLVAFELSDTSDA